MAPRKLPPQPPQHHQSFNLHRTTTTNSTKSKWKNIRHSIVCIVTFVVCCEVSLLLWYHNNAVIVPSSSSSSSSSTSSSSRSSPSLTPGGSSSSFSTTTTTTTTTVGTPAFIGGGSCAILLFGLPRAFKQYVLPSFVRNVININKQYHCDYYIHFYNDTMEGKSRSGRGGTIHPDDVVTLLPTAIQNIHTAYSNTTTTTPIVSMISDTNTTFWQSRYEELMKFRTTRNDDGNWTYFPYLEPTYVWPTTLDNMVRQWHSIQRVWDHMVHVGMKQHSKQYDRVAMMRNDVLYITPIDIYKLPHSKSSAVSTNTMTSSSLSLPLYDYNNQYVIIPNWAKYPINDRYISGPFHAVELWATKRFEYIDEYSGVSTTTTSRNTRIVTTRRTNSRFDRPEPGRVMHSETFLNATVFKVIQNDLHIPILEDNWICFLRVRADGAIWIEDCHGSMVGFGGIIPTSPPTETAAANHDGVHIVEKVHDAPPLSPQPPGFPGNVMELIQPFLPPTLHCRKRKLNDKIRIVIELFCGRSSSRPKGFTKKVRKAGG